MLTRRDKERPHLARPTQLGKHRRELNALGASSDDEGEGGHLNRGMEGRRARGQEVRRSGLKTVQRCKSERSSCAKVQT
jgi:hypothetical protein